MLKIPTGRRQTSWLFTSVLEPGTSGFQVRRSYHWAMSPPHSSWIAIVSTKFDTLNCLSTTNRIISNRSNMGIEKKINLAIKGKIWEYLHQCKVIPLSGHISSGAHPPPPPPRADPRALGLFENKLANAPHAQG